MAFLGGRLGGDNGLTVDDGLGLNHLSADFEDGLVGVYGERTGDGDVMGGHRFGEALPAREGVTLLDRGSLGRDDRAIGNGYLFVEGAVDIIDELVGVDRVAT